MAIAQSFVQDPNGTTAVLAQALSQAQASGDSSAAAQAIAQAYSTVGQEAN